MRIVIDIETRSDVDIADCGSYRYALSPNFQILLLGYKIDNSPAQVVDLTAGEPIPETILHAFESRYIQNARVRLVAHNAQFEHWCLKQSHLDQPIELWSDTMIKALYCGYPPSLAALGKALGLKEEDRKMSVGTALITYFCKPMTESNQKKFGRMFHASADDPEKWELFKTYCKQDVETEALVDDELTACMANEDLPPLERLLWRADVEMNARGVNIDRDLLGGALSIIDASTQALTARMQQLTGLRNPNSLAQMREWLSRYGIDTANLAKDSVADLIERYKDDPEMAAPVEALRIRQELGKSSLAKYEKIKDAICPDGRVRGISQFYGAGRTGRYSGRLVQMQNLPRNHMADLDTARELAKIGDFEVFKMCYGNVPDTLSQLIRTVFIPSEGHKYVVADFSAIEARVLAWMAGETWVNEVFRTTGKIYEATAAQMFGVPADRIVKGNPEYELRQKGKVATLALGYQGGTQAMIAMGALRQGLSESELPEIVERWRAANPHIVSFWKAVEDAAIQAVTRGETQVAIPGGAIRFWVRSTNSGQKALCVLLPSGRELHYVNPSVSENRFGRPALHYYGLGAEGTGWGIKSTYGGSLTENLTQAIARDCLTHVLRSLWEENLQFVFHVHDEVIVDVDPNLLSVERLCDMMAQPIVWAPGLVLKGAGFESDYYMKD